MAQYAITYAPNLSGGAPANTTNTGSFHIGNLVQGRIWNQEVPQTTTNTLFFASPNDNDGYLMALPNPLKPAPFNGLDQPQFFKSLTNGVPAKTDAAFITTCDYILKTYQTDGTVGQPPASPGGCNSVASCKSSFTSFGWFQSYGFTAP